MRERPKPDSRRIRRSDRRRQQRRQHGIRIAALILGSAAMLFGLSMLIRYGMDLFFARKTAQELRNAYHQAESPDVIPESTFRSPGDSDSPGTSPSPASTDTPAEVLPSSSGAPAESAPSASLRPEAPTEASLSSLRRAASPAASANPPAVSPTSLPWLLDTAYPHNPNLKISSRFKALQQTSRYVVGWLTIDKLIDEAVVQRDNTYFLTHDAQGKKNVNGALFLDEHIQLRARPYTYLVYGHNMKTGAMFGALRNFENVDYYHKVPFLTFDTLYEEGKYVVFSVGNLSTESRRNNYVSLSALQSIEISKREGAVAALQSISIYQPTVEVNAEDRILLLITCVEEESDRRVVAARRIRENETEEELARLVRMSWKKR